MRSDPRSAPAPHELPIAQVVAQGRGAKCLRAGTIRERIRQRLRPYEPSARHLARHVVGFWPVIAVVGLVVGLLWSAGLQEP